MGEGVGGHRGRGVILGEGLFPVRGQQTILRGLVFIGMVHHKPFGGEGGVRLEFALNDDADVLAEHLGGHLHRAYRGTGFGAMGFAVAYPKVEDTLGLIPEDRTPLYHPPQAYGRPHGFAALGQHFAGCPIIDEVFAEAALGDEEEGAAGEGQGAEGEELVSEFRLHIKFQPSGLVPFDDEGEEQSAQNPIDEAESGEEGCPGGEVLHGVGFEDEGSGLNAGDEGGDEDGEHEEGEEDVLRAGIMGNSGIEGTGGGDSGGPP